MRLSAVLDLLRNIVVEFVAVFAEMSPYLLFGFFVAGLLSMLVSRKMVERHLGGSGMMPLIKASIFGVPLPLCSCGVIPVAMSLHKHGASRGATIAFLLSTPQTGVDSIFVTYSLLGPVFAVFRPVAAFVTGLVGGVLVNLFGQGPEDVGQTNPPPAAQTQECAAAPTVKQKFVDGMKHGFVTMPRNIGKALLLGLVIAAVIAALVPDDFFAQHLGRGLPAMLVMMAIGIPIYVCASASVPVAAALMGAGLSPGAALVFLMTGPATNAAGLTTIWNTLGRRTAILYLMAVAVCSLVSGLILDAILTETHVHHAMSHAHAMLPQVVEYASAVVLLALLGYAFLAKKRD
ncbi:MAG TPA: SO_0444 family Cu/Zn efflux transporter [Sedimentisphaerales bacterium]|nr:SO_0444 family Cu/Zn efflux transporter [Sedimentisphaerales bacterium]